MAEPSRRFYQTFGLIYQDRQKERSQLSYCGRGIILPPGSGKEPAKMNLSKPIKPIRNYALGSTSTALIALSPVLAFLMVIATEMLIDLMMVGGTSVICAVAAGGIGLVLYRKFWRRPQVAHQSKPELVPGETSVAAASM